MRIHPRAYARGLLRRRIKRLDDFLSDYSSGPVIPDGLESDCWEGLLIVPFVEFGNFLIWIHHGCYTAATLVIPAGGAAV